MTDEPKPLEVEAIPGERMVFLVRSETNPRRQYRVDLLAHGGMGECGCRRWCTGVWPMIRDGKLTLDMPCEDKHIEAARRVFLRDVLRHMAEQERDPHTKPSG